VKPHRPALLGAGVHPAQAGEAARQPALLPAHEVLLIRRIRELLYEEGFTISGARNRLDNSLTHEDKPEPRARRAGGGRRGASISPRSNASCARSSSNCKGLKAALGA